MKAIRAIAWGMVGAMYLLVAVEGRAQIVINEVVKEQINPDSGAAINPDTREFIELYNTGNAPVNIGGWTLNYFRVSGAVGTVNTYLMVGGQTDFDIIPANTMLGPGQFYVLGSTGVENVNQALDLGTPTDLFEDAIATVVELRSGTVASSAPLVDAVAYDTGRTGITNPNLSTGPRFNETGHGFHGRPIWSAKAGHERVSLGRWVDGRDTNSTGRDFGILMDTPGASNTMPFVADHQVPTIASVNALANGADVPGYYSPFVKPRAVDPTVVGPVGGAGFNVNPSAIPAPPVHTGATKVISVWDETGGGNVVHATQRSDKFDIYAYFDTSTMVVTGATGPSTENTTYGIGTADPFYGTADPEGTIFPTNTTYVQNSSAGLGWMYQRRTNTDGTPQFSNLYLVDFNAGGDSRPGGNTWSIEQEIDMSTKPSGWYRLSIDYNPATNDVTAIFDNQTFNFNADEELEGGFFVGYRTAISNFTNNRPAHDPARFIDFVSPSLAGDFNGDGTVDAADYVLWRKTNPGNATMYAEWKQNFGSSSPGSGGGGAVPEPASLMLVVLGLAAAGMSRVRR